MSKKPTYEELEQRIKGLEKEVADLNQTDETLHKSATLYKAIVESSPMGMHFYELKGDNRLVFKGANTAADRLLGVDNSIFIGKTVEEAFPPLIQTEIPFKYRQVATTGETWSTEQIEYEDKKIIGAFEVFVFQTEPSKIVAMFNDITHRKRWVKALKQSELRLNSTQEITKVGGWEWDVQHQTMFWTEEAYRIHGYNPEEIEAGSIEHIESSIKCYDEKDRSAIIEAFQKCITEGKPYDMELPFTTINNQRIWIRTTAKAIKENGKITRVLGNIADITDRKKAEAAIIKERDRAQRYLDVAGVMFLAIDLHQNVTMINQKGCDILGFEEHEIVGKNWFDNFIKTENIDEIKNIFNEIISGNVEPFEYDESSITIKGGEERNIAWHNSVIRGESGQIIGTLSSGEDITERKRIEKHLQQAQKMEAIGTLAGGIAHDFNNILSAIFGYSELTLSNVEPGTLIHGNLSKILKAGERARDLVQQILIFSRQSDRELLPVQIKPAVKEVVKFIRATLPSSIEIRQNLKNDPTVIADPSQVHQIIMNLCTNAGHAIEDKGGILEIGLESLELDYEFTKRHSGLQTGNYIKLTVSDTGTGIPSENLSRIFDPYFTTKEKGKGTGLGLATVHGIVKSNGGTITVESQVGEGTKFEVYLPSVEDSYEINEDSESKLKGGRERILLVDDESDIIEIQKQMLDKLGYKVTATDKANDALKIFATKPDQFDLVISDMTMPKMTGDKLAVELIKIRPDIPVLLCTGFSENMSKEKATSLGIKGYLMKPITLENLSLEVRNVLDKG